LDASAIKAKMQSSCPDIHVIGNGTMSILCSEPLEDIETPKCTVGQRLVLSRTAFHGRQLAVINYHGEAQGLQGSPDPTERGGIASEIRWLIDKHAATAEALVMGDFNAEPESSEITSMYCMSFATDPSYTSRRSHDHSRAVLRYVPMTFPAGVQGTKWTKSTSKGKRWQTFDFIVASERLAVMAEACKDLDGELLFDGVKIMLSDHLPVSGTMDLL
jgi:endonuclease/exonuclease/phosphatase family metal-dependent hydrolase